METTSRSKQQFCRCGHARSFTLQGLRHICRDPKCECVKHDTAVADRREAPTAVGADPIDSHLLDRVLMAGALEHLQRRIKVAREHLECGLVMRALGRDDVAGRRFADALLALGNLGAA